MARTPDDEYPESEPTQYANYGDQGSGQAYSEYGEPTGAGRYAAPYEGQYPPPGPVATPWHQRPAVLVGLGVLTAAVLALLVYAVVKFTTAGQNAPTNTTTSSTTSTTSTAATSTDTSTAPSTTTQTVAPAPTTITSTVTTTTVPTTTVAPTTTETPTTTPPSVTTITETTTKRLWPTLPTLRPPTLYEPPPGQ